MYITLISLSFVNVELFLVNTETPLKSRNQCRYFKGPTLLNLQLKRSILIPQSFYYVALPFMQKLICEIKNVDKILWYKCTDTSLAFANFVPINYQWMNCFEFHVRPTSFGFNVLEFSRVFPRPGSLRTKLSLCYRLHNQVPSSSSSPSSPILGQNWKHDLARSCFILETSLSWGKISRFKLSFWRHYFPSPATSSRSGGAVWLTCLGITFLTGGFCFPCAFIPFCIEDMKVGQSKLTPSAWRKWPTTKTLLKLELYWSDFAFTRIRFIAAPTVAK